ncbi:MAG: hypothetical protein CM15mV87_030 [Caudoviricetes sp.]|nr:MAG: hypothetical protein CM15mV87_030 [Caudoviricetes sp.]
MRPLVRNYAEQVVKNQLGSQIFSFCICGRCIGSNDLSNTAIDPTSKTITLLRTLENDDINGSGEAAPRNVAADIGRLFGEAIQKIDTDLTALFGGFNYVGSASTVMSLFKFFPNSCKLRANAVPGDNPSAVIHPQVAFDLKSGLTNTFSNPNPGGNEILRSSLVGQIEE